MRTTGKLEDLLAELNNPNTALDAVGSHFSRDHHRVTLEALLGQSVLLQRDLIVIKASGRLLLDEAEPGEHLTNREYFVSALTVLSQLGVNAFVIHGGQEQLDRVLKAGGSISREALRQMGVTGSHLDKIVEAAQEVTEAERESASEKIGEMRYTPPGLRYLIVSMSEALSEGLKADIRNAGGSANAYPSSLFVGTRRSFRDKPDNCYASLPLDNRKLRAIPRREERVRRYLEGRSYREDGLHGRMVIRGFVVNDGDKTHEEIEYELRNDPHANNGDADNVAAAHAVYFSRRNIIPVKSSRHALLMPPARVHLIELARSGGLRKSTGHYDNIVSMVTHERDLNNREIEGGMAGKVHTSLQVARALGNLNVHAVVKIMHVRELLAYFVNEPVLWEAGGYGTTFASGGEKAIQRFYAKAR